MKYGAEDTSTVSFPPGDRAWWVVYYNNKEYFILAKSAYEAKNTAGRLRLPGVHGSDMKCRLA